jgi:DNA-binding NarL/FixJ family response regulator
MLADDHPLVPVAVRNVFEGTEFEIVAIAQTGGQVLPLIGRSAPDLLLLDLKMPGIDGLRVLELLHQRRVSLRVVVFSGDDDPERIATALRLGAIAYLLKTLSISDLPTLLREVGSGHVYHAPRSWVQDAHRHAVTNAGITPKEHTLLQLLAEGLSNQEIATRLWLSRETVKTHLSNVYRKLGVTSRTEAVVAAYDLHLLEPRSRPGHTVA